MFYGELRRTHFPYCLRKQPDGSYVLLNRKYKPIGFLTQEHVAYEDHPVGMQLKGLGPKLAEVLDVNGRADPDSIYLYDNGSRPTKNEACMNDYLKKLGLLMTIKVSTKGD